MFQYISNNLIIIIFCLFIIIILYIKIDRSDNKEYEIIKTIKIILYYDSSNDINLSFIDSIWKQLSTKYYNKFNFNQIDIYKNKYFTNYNFYAIETTTPIIYVLGENDIIYKYNRQLTFNDIENFIITCSSLIY